MFGFGKSAVLGHPKTTVDDKAIERVQTVRRLGVPKRCFMIRQGTSRENNRRSCGSISPQWPLSPKIRPQSVQMRSARKILTQSHHEELNFWHRYWTSGVRDETSEESSCLLSFQQGRQQDKQNGPFALRSQRSSTSLIWFPDSTRRTGQPMTIIG